MSEQRPVGVIVVGHGSTATQLLEAARGIVPHGSLDDVVPVDAGVGETSDLSALLCGHIERIDAGRGVVVLVDLLGASPCNCAQRQGKGRGIVTLSGLNLAMLLKLAGLDRQMMSASEIAHACADSATRSVKVSEPAASAAGGAP